LNQNLFPKRREVVNATKGIYTVELTIRYCININIVLDSTCFGFCVVQTATESIGFWIGGCRSDTDGWVWSTACSSSGPSTNVTSKMTYTNWDHGQPTDSARCLFMQSGSKDFSWSNYYCSGTNKYPGMLCQKDAMSSG
jgi:hypothetical protein